MTDIILFSSGRELLFIILVMIPILFYLIWRIGYSLRKVKIPMLLSIVGAFYFFFTAPDLFFTFEQSLNTVIGKLLSFNLLFFSTIFTIIILVVPSNQNISNTSQSSIIQEEISDFAPLLDLKDDKNMRYSASMENRFKEERDFTEDRGEEHSEILNEGNSDNEFQNLIKNLFEKQNKKQKE